MAGPIKRRLIVFLLILSVGTPWGILQSVAWFGMFLKFSSQSSPSQALRMTFDGKHPCKMCLLIKEGKQREKQQPKQGSESVTKLELALAPLIGNLFHPPIPAPSYNPAAFASQATFAPPFPPPRQG